MDVLTQSDCVEVRRIANRGQGSRGVFAKRLIRAGEVIERVPVILIPSNQVFGESAVALKACRLSWYVFGWGIQQGHEYVALPLGYGSIYNHSYEPNAASRNEMPDVMEFVALKEIAKDEEITINYNGDPEDKGPVDFPVAR